MIHIITQYYQVKYNCDKDLVRKRQDEITYCFKKNLENPIIEKIHFLYELEEDVKFLEEEGITLNNEKIELFNLGKRLKYSDIFYYANIYLPNKICVYLHADMCVDSGFEKLNDINLNNTIYALTSHKLDCNNNFICNCTRQFKTRYGFFGVTFDGFAFKSPLNSNVVKECNHIVHMLGSETRTVCILKENGYKVICPNQILKCYHHHTVKIFASQHSKWINRKGEIKDQSYYSKIHKNQKGKPFNELIVGGGIPFFYGSCLLVNNL